MMRILAFVSLSLFIATTGRSFSFITNDNGLPIKWPAGQVPLVVALGNTPTLSDGNTFNSSTQAAISAWNNQIGSVAIQAQPVAARGPINNNRVNEAGFASTVFGSAFDENVLAVTTTTYSGNDRLEGDILFNSARTWDSYRGNTRTAIDVQRVAAHELGHLLGLNHPDEDGQTVSAIMNSRIGNLDTLAFDDIVGARRLYGPPGIPANDAFASAELISGSGRVLQVTGFNTNATKESGEPSHANNSGGRSVWWRWVAPASGPVYVNTQGSLFDTTLGIYTGNSVNALTAIASDDDLEDGVIQYSSLTFNAVSGTTYYFAVDGYDADSAFITLTLEAGPPTITSHPVSTAGTEGGSASFSVTVSAIGSTPTFTWRRDGATIGNSGTTTSVGTNSYRNEFTLSNLQATQAGSYTVTIGNNSGETTSNAAALTVFRPVANSTVSEGRSISFHAGTGGPFQWQISTDGGTSFSNVGNNATYSGASTDTLTISNASASLSGTRYRVVSTSAGVTTAGDSFALTVAAPLVPNPSGLASNAAGNLTIADATLNTLQKFTTSAGVTAFAGTSGQAGSTDGVGAAARFNQPGGLALASSGVIYLSDTANATIRRVATDGTVTTFAGSTTLRGNVDGTSATFSAPRGLALDAAGNLYVADETNHTIRKITPGGVVSTYAGSAGSSGTTNATTATAARFNRPTGVASDAAGNLYIADTFNHTIRRITVAGVVTTFAGLEQTSGSTDGPGLSAALFNRPSGLALDAAGNLYVADTGNSTVRKITPAGVVSTLAGLATVSGLKDGTGPDAWFNQPQALALDSTANVYVADTGNAALRKITPAGVVTTLSLSPTATPPTTPSTPTPPPAAPAPSGGGGGGGGGAPSHVFLGALALLCVARLLRR